MGVWDSEELVDGEPSPIAPSDSAGARRCEIEVESFVSNQHFRSNLRISLRGEPSPSPSYQSSPLCCYFTFAVLSVGAAW